MSGTSEELDLVTSTTRSLITDGLASDAGVWAGLAAAELLSVAVAEPAGGDWLTAGAAVIRVWAGLAAPDPIPEAVLIGGPLVAAAGLALPSGRFTVAHATGEVRQVDDGLEISLAAARVPEAASADQIVLVVDDFVVVVAAATAAITPGRNVASEPRDGVTVSGVIAAGEWGSVAGAADELRNRGALARAIALSGAAAAALELTVQYAGERTQFGRPISKFQVVQHAVAELAVEVEAMSAAANAAVSVCEAEGFTTDAARLAIAIAKAQASAGAGTVAKLAHQVHGAIGTTQEHSLHRLTTRLWSWREEYGSERAWQEGLGQAILDTDIWELVT